MKLRLLQVLVSCLAVFSLYSQNTVGLLSYTPDRAYDGYNLYYPHNQSTVYLIDNCGEIVHSWPGEDNIKPGNMAYLLDDGRLVTTSRPSDITQDAIWAGGGGANIEIKDWDNNVEWTYTLNDSTARLHHDIAPIVKNGKLTILAIAWEQKSLDEVIEAGRDTSVLASGELWPDYIFEIDPETNAIVWEWHVWDHLIQDFDPSKSNYGVIADNPGKVDINYDFDGSGNADWMHSNALDYDPINAQILLCVPNFHEVWIIDHTTTTAEAATSFGGFGGKGGDLMYRWGNPAVHGAGTAEDQTLFYPHDAHFIDDFITGLDPTFGKIGIFNNRVGADYSTINIFDPAFDMYEWAFPMSGSNFFPSEFELDKKHPVDSTLMWSTGLSSLQYLPNTNLLVCVGRFGYTYEMTQEGEIVWEYKTPIIGGFAATQGDTLSINNNLTFRVTRYPHDYVAFDGKDLSQKGWLELEPNTTFCDQILPSDDVQIDYKIEIYPNPADNMIVIEWDESMYVDIEVFDIIGHRRYLERKVSGGMKYIDTSTLENGTYILRLNGEDAKRFLVVK